MFASRGISRCATAPRVFGNGASRARVAPVRCVASSSGRADASGNPAARKTRASKLASTSGSTSPTAKSNATRPLVAEACGDADAPCFPEAFADDAGAPRAYNDDLDKMIQMLPVDVRDVLINHELRDSLLEVVLDLGRCPEARFAGSPNQCLRSEPITQADLDAAESAVGDFGGDNRAGIQGTLHRISAMRNRAGRIVGLTCRVGRALRGHVDMIDDLLRGGSESILFLGRPGVGKTTVIREIARVLSDDLGKRVVIIDTSNEIGGDGDVPHPAIGGARRMQVPDPSEQHRVMIEAVENHMPEVIIVDEIGTEMEALACRTIAERGVQLVGTAHGQLLENLIKNPTLSDLVGGVQSVTLGDDEARARGCQKSIMERQAPPTFPILVEMHERTLWVAHNVEESVDEVLAGGRPIVQMRTREEGTGVVRVDQAAYDMDVILAQNSVAHTLGSMGGIMGTTSSVDEVYFGGAMEYANNVSSRPKISERAAASAAASRGASAGSTSSAATPAPPASGGGKGAAPADEEDPYAWATSLGMVPDKDALEAMGAGGYLAGGKMGGVNQGNGVKRGNGKREKKTRSPRACRARGQH